MAGTATDRLDVLLVEDNPGDARLIQRHLQRDTTVLAPPRVEHVSDLVDAIDTLERNNFDLVLLDLGLPGSRGLDTLDRVTTSDVAEEVPVVVLTGLDDDHAAVEAIQRGAQDYLVKGELDGDMLERAVRYAVERHRQELALRAKNERLEEFASLVSHDLRNPLQVISTHVGILDADLDDHPSVEALDRSTDRMEQLIDDVLTLARQGDSVYETQRVDLATLAGECWRVVDTDRATVDVATDLVFRADRGRLRSLLENLFRNAVEHGGDDVTVTVGDTAGGFFVADDGPGFPDDVEVFERGETTSRSGTGFGLSIVAEIAGAQGWAVEARESEAGGARVDVTGVERV